MKRIVINLLMLAALAVAITPAFAAGKNCCAGGACCNGGSCCDDCCK
ncbi:MAG TPA: hypothetical protein VHW24_19640 [Bryobacteraceae bacterium]|nr:hypothetical protein [Bryobacteraceae bacterium]